MLLIVVVAALVLGIAFYQVVRGLFSALIMAILSLLCAMLAFNFYEPFAQSLLYSRQPTTADAISLVNTIPGMVIDTETRRPFLGGVTGGLSGPAIRPIAVRMVWEVARAVQVPVIGMGGIRYASDALEFLIAGAAAVAVGSANFADPRASLDVIDGIEKYMARHGIKTMAELTGSLELPD